jgi:4-amino-4-deoxy-L-arabinose transferase-like glycosyltransferase
MLKQRKKWIVFLTLLLVAAAFRIAVAHWLPNDAPDDGKTYAQIARNVLEQHVYSHATEAPYDPSLIRLPGYPLFLAGVYSVFGHTNNGAVRIVQALIDTGTCALVALLAFYWEPDEKRKRATAIAALVLAVVCPFTTIYAATILTEVPATFLVMGMCLAATLAFRTENWKRSIPWWLVAGLLGGMAVLFRPDSGLFAAAVGLTLGITCLIWRERSGDGVLARSSTFRRILSPHQSRLKAVLQTIQSGVALRLPAHSKDFSRTMVAGAAFSLAFVVLLVPWTIRNARVFHLFQPLAPSHGEMPGEFVPRGYNSWLRTWLDDEAYIGPFLWALDDRPINLDDVPPTAFDSADEKARVAALLDKYNHPSGAQATNPAQPQPSPTPAPQTSPTEARANPELSTGKAKPNPTTTPQKNTNANSNSNAEDSGDEGDQNDNSGDQNDNSSDQGDESDNNTDESDQSSPEEHGAVEMTPEIDAGFAQIARERSARHPFRYYVWLPLKRVRTMWFDTHSQYWPFEGTLLPLEDLDHGTHQQFWLPLFAGLTAIYTLLGLAGGWLLWNSRKFDARRWLLLVSLAIVLRLILFSSLENPESRYLVEFFPFLAVLGGVAIARVPKFTNKPQNSQPQINTDSHR